MLDADKRTVVDDPLLRIATHVVFSSECLIATAGCADLAEGLRRVARHTDSFLAVSNGPNDILFLEESLLRRVPVFAIRAVDTLGAGDALHGGFALALAEGRGEAAALRFAAAVAGLKCTAAPPACRRAPKSMRLWRSTTGKPRAGAARLAAARLDLEYFSI